MINRLKYGFHIYNPMVDDFKNKYSVAYKMAEIAKGVLEERIGIEMTEDEMGFLAAYFGVFLLEQEPEEKRCKIAIVCGSGKIIGRLIENQLKKVFDVEPEFEFSMVSSMKIAKMILIILLRRQNYTWIRKPRLFLWMKYSIENIFNVNLKI